MQNFRNQFSIFSKVERQSADKLAVLWNWIIMHGVEFCREGWETMWKNKIIYTISLRFQLYCFRRTRVPNKQWLEHHLLVPTSNYIRKLSYNIYVYGSRYVSKIKKEISRRESNSFCIELYPRRRQCLIRALCVSCRTPWNVCWKFLSYCETLEELPRTNVQYSGNVLELQDSYVFCVTS